jgi:uncharacterized membrane protein
METQDKARGSINITATERTVRTACGTGALVAIVSGTVDTPLLIFVLCLAGAYLIQTGTSGTDPVYALARYMHTNRLQVWQHTLTSGAMLPILITGDLVSSFIVFCLSAVGGFFVTTAIVGKDAIDAAAAWLAQSNKTAASGMFSGSPCKEAPA